MAREDEVKKVNKPWRVTPLIESTNLSKAAGCRVFLKLDNLQPSGSFKSRGIGAFCLHALRTLRMTDPKAVPHFFASSGGNAGLACVYAAKDLGCPCTVVVPLSTKQMMIDRLLDAGASDVVQSGTSLPEADEHMKTVVMPEAERRGEATVCVHPFDHPVTWQGHASIIDEIDHQMAEEGPPDVVVCSVGGGGLVNGIIQGAEEHAWNNTTVLAVETKGADSLAYSLKHDKIMTLPSITSQATSLGARKVSQRTFDLAQRYIPSGRFKYATFTDEEAAMACWRFADDERLMVELACGVSVAVCYGGRLAKALGRPVHPDEKVVIEVCGGSNVTTAMLETWRKEIGNLDRK
ncbi:tryptophan synthase beta subunit-like PLP-dependent enzyme [Piedraia hortae CBS 480.64]|uniref:L-serine ammonia-lyase n=1 Tax=Piedraia hortae CBS 480.64 TaxID=1314780 RepID=A0A6A7C7S7_9PEZI|nr:tryptophan synthase beta subunit-like PLP-dependent enzyme [Piedraia hortae CBS 480.64]